MENLCFVLCVFRFNIKIMVLLSNLNKIIFSWALFMVFLIFNITILILFIDINYSKIKILIISNEGFKIIFLALTFMIIHFKLKVTKYTNLVLLNVYFVC